MMVCIYLFNEDMCLGEYVPCMYRCSQKPEEGVKSTGTGVKGGCWEQTLSPLKEQQEFLPLTTSATPLLKREIASVIKK